MLYKVTVNFGGFIGADEEYEIEANSREEAEQYALEEAYSDVTVSDVEELDEENEE